MKRIPKEELERVFLESDSASAEMDYSFMCFEDAYRIAAEIAQKDTIILDFGCAYAPQSYYFTKCEKYIGIDLPFRNNVKFTPPNAEFFLMKGQEFIEKVFYTKGYNLTKVIAICSWVPDEELQNIVKRFPNHIVCYGKNMDMYFRDFYFASPIRLIPKKE